MRRALLLIVSFVVPVAGHAQAPSVEGFVLGFAVEALRSDSDALPAMTGGGAGALIGVGAFRHFVLTFGAGVAGGGDGLLGHAGFGARAYPPLDGRVRPYLELGFMSHGRELSDERLALGNGFTLGAGTELFWQHHRSIVVSATWWSGHFDEIAYESDRIDIPARNLRLSAGVHLRPPRWRRPEGAERENGTGAPQAPRR